MSATHAQTIFRKLSGKVVEGVIARKRSSPGQYAGAHGLYASSCRVGLEPAEKKKGESPSSAPCRTVWVLFSRGELPSPIAEFGLRIDLRIHFFIEAMKK
jgi:hypothetical protein